MDVSDNESPEFGAVSTPFTPELAGLSSTYHTARLSNTHCGGALILTMLSCFVSYATSLPSCGTV